jgi:hypothetical protein
MTGKLKDFEDYVVHSNGDIYSLKRNRFLIKQKDKDGYEYIRLHKNGKQYRKLIHRLVAECFIHTDDTKLEVNHINGIKSDNDYRNLEWCTRIENIRHSWNMGFSKYQKHVVDAMNEAKRRYAQ